MYVHVHLFIMITCFHVVVFLTVMFAFLPHVHLLILPIFVGKIQLSVSCLTTEGHIAYLFCHVVAHIYYKQYFSTMLQLTFITDSTFLTRSTHLLQIVSCVQFDSRGPHCLPVLICCSTHILQIVSWDDQLYFDSLKCLIRKTCETNLHCLTDDVEIKVSDTLINTLLLQLLELGLKVIVRYEHHARKR